MKEKYKDIINKLLDKINVENGVSCLFNIKCKPLMDIEERDDYILNTIVYSFDEDNLDNKIINQLLIKIFEKVNMRINDTGDFSTIIFNKLKGSTEEEKILYLLDIIDFKIKKCFVDIDNAISTWILVSQEMFNILMKNDKIININDKEEYINFNYKGKLKDYNINIYVDNAKEDMFFMFGHKINTNDILSDVKCEIYAPLDYNNFDKYGLNEKEFELIYRIKYSQNTQFCCMNGVDGKDSYDVLYFHLNIIKNKE